MNILHNRNLLLYQYMKQFVFIVVIVFVCAAGSFADKTSGTSSMTFLKLEPGARPAGMGNAFSAVANDPSALYWNPAGLAAQDVAEVSTEFFSYIEDTSVQHLMFAMPVLWNKPVTYAGGITFLQSGGFKRTAVSNNTYGFDELGEFDARDISMSLGTGMEINPQAAVGIAIKYLQETIDDEQAAAGAVDIGMLLKSQDRPFQLGLIARHVGTSVTFKDRSFELPAVYVLSVARILPRMGWLGIEGVFSSDNDLEFKAGLEFPLAPFLAVRAGYAYPFNKSEMGDLTDITAGIGFNFSYYRLDYAIASYGDFGYAHHVSMNFRFGISKQDASIRKRIEKKQIIYLD